MRLQPRHEALISIRSHFEIHERITRFNSLVYQCVCVCVCACVSPVSFVVHGDYIHGDVILLMWVQTRNLDAHGGKHPPDGKTR